MDSYTLFFTASLIGIGLYWFVFVLGSAEQKGKRAVHLSSGSISGEKVLDNYNQYSSFFRRRPKEIVETADDKVSAFVDTFYNLVTDIYEWGWGQSFHFSPSIPGKSHREATRIHEVVAADLLASKPGDRVLDAGCGFGPLRRECRRHHDQRVPSKQSSIPQPESRSRRPLPRHCWELPEHAFRRRQLRRRVFDRGDLPPAEAQGSIRGDLQGFEARRDVRVVRMGDDGEVRR